MSKITKSAKNGRVSNYTLLAIVVIAAIVINGVAIYSDKTDVNHDSNTAEVGQTQKVSWDSSSIVGDSVSVNLIKKVSDNPNTYTLVREVSDRTANDGIATWVPALSDVGNGLSLEIGCAPSKSACTAIDNFNSDLAVVDSGRFSNTAAAYKAIEARENK